MRILFTTVALPGHFFPLVPLAWACRVAGHEVLVATSDNFVPTVLGAGLPAAGCGPVADFVDLAGGQIGAPGLAEQRYANGRAFGRIAVYSLPGVTSLLKSWRPELVVSERAEFAGPIAATVDEIPYLEFQWGVAPLREYRQAAAAELSADLLRLGLGGLPEPTRVLNPWPPSLRQPHAAGNQSIRYVSYNGAARVATWLLEPRDTPRICLTLGTVLPRARGDWTAETVIPIIERLASLDVELLIAVDDKIAATWPRLPPAVRHAGWTPLSHAFAACDLSIHHAGHGTTLTAVAAGHPQLLLPQFDDQFDNADAVVRAGAGISLRSSETTPLTVAERCRELVEEPRFKNSAAEVAAELLVQPLPAEVVGVLEVLAS